MQSLCNCERATSFSDSVLFALGQCSSYQSPSAMFPSPSALLICKNYAVCFSSSKEARIQQLSEGNNLGMGNIIRHVFVN